MEKNEVELTRLWVRWLAPSYVDDVIYAPEDGSLDDLIEWWQSMTLEEKNEKCKSIVEEIEMMFPGKTSMEFFKSG